MKGHCIDCRFRDPNGTEGLCQRHAPRPLVVRTSLEDSPEAHFPSTCGGDWCGEFQKRLRRRVDEPH